MLCSLINRTILWELCKIFVLSLVGITGLLLLAVVVIEAQNQGLGPVQIMTIVPLVIPSTLPYTIPATTLFSTCVVYGRLAHDNEILAIRAAGINIMHVVWPAAALGLLMSVSTMALYYSLIPTTYHLMKSVFLDDIDAVIYTVLKREGRFAHPKSDYVMYVRRVEGRTLIKPVFLHRDPRSKQFDIVATARDAELLVNLPKKEIEINMRDCDVAGKEPNGYSDGKFWSIPLPPDPVEDRRYRRSDMTWEELQQRVDQLKEHINETDHQIAHAAAQLTLANSPNNLEVHLRNLRNVKKAAEQQIRDLVAEMHRRPALALGCLCFVLVGCPVGIWFSRSDYLSAFVTCFLPIVVIYYPLVLCGENLARGGTVPLAVGIWFPDALMGVIALVLYRRLLKH